MSRFGRPLTVALLACACLASAPAGADAASIEAQYAIARIDSAVLEADIDPQGEPTTCQAQYVPEEVFQVSGYATAITVPCDPSDLGSGAGAVTATASLEGLDFDTTYHYRFLAGGVEGADQTFSTFGIEALSFQAFDAGGEPEVQAGSHPERLTTTITLNTTRVRERTTAAGIAKDILTELPPGLVGSAAAVPQCPSRLAEAELCPGASQVGRIWISYLESKESGPAALFSVVPPKGKAARFAAVVNVSTAAFIDSSVRTGEDYGITAGARNITSLANTYAVKVEVWGVPGSPLHDTGRSCPTPGGIGFERGCASTAPEAPLLTMPTECSGDPLEVGARADAYARPGLFSTRTEAMPAIVGCNALEFEPSIEARPTTNVADSPSGLHVDLHVPQPPAPEASATPTLSCDTGSWEGAPSEFSFRWLRNGTPIPGAEDPTYTQHAADAGSVLQCEVEATNGAGPGFAASQAFLARPISRPAPTTLGIGSAVEISGSVDSSGGTLKCERGAWPNSSRAPATTFTQRWFRNGVLVPGEAGSTYTLGPGEAPLSVQCEVLATRVGATAVAFSKAFVTEPPPELAPPSPLAGPQLGLEGAGPELATANLRDAVVKLPPGLTVNPSSAAGLQGCGPAQLGLTTPVGVSPIQTTPDPARCPDASRLGTVEVETPLLDHPLPGAVYLAQPYENPFESLLAIYIAVHDPISGVVLKLAGRVEIGPGGQLTTSFEENPQLPFEHFRLDFHGGARAPLKTPPTCGRYETTTTLTPWSAPETGPPATPLDSYEITQAPGGGACPTSAGAQPNSPRFAAGTESLLAGAFTPFLLRLSRGDGSQVFRSLTITPPPGLLGKLAGLSYCPEAALAAAAARSGVEEQAAPSCPASSEVGGVTVGAGAGPAPYHVDGRAYLAGPYRDAPLSLAIVTPAVAGPYDLGTVVVRSALEVDPETAQITVESDPIPTELKGIPVDVRSIAVKVGRSEFTLNPTNCEAMGVTGALTSPLGSVAPLSSRFQVGECGRLKFTPRLSLSLKGKTRRGGNPAFKAVLRMGSGQANIARASVALPRAVLLDQGHIRTVCTRVQYAAAAGHGAGCPAGSVYGHARAHSPLLDRPLEGPVFLRSSSHELPDLVAALRGQIDVDLSGRIDSVNRGMIRNTFEVVPDAPVSRFVLTMRGGRKGLLQNSANVCRGKHRARVRFVSQSGRVHDSAPPLRGKCGKAKRRHGQHRRSG